MEVPTHVNSPDELAQLVATDYPRAWVISAERKGVSFVVGTSDESEEFLPAADIAFFVLVEDGTVFEGLSAYEAFRSVENQQIRPNLVWERRSAEDYALDAETADEIARDNSKETI